MYTFSHIPKPIDPSLYVSQTDLAVGELLKAVPDIVAIYTMGEQDLCGLSDIDFLCIMRDKTDLKEAVISKISKQFSLLDTPHCIDEKSIEDLLYFPQRPFLVHVWWKKYEIPKLQDDAKIVFAWRLCFIGLLRIFYPAFYTKKISISLLLKQIYYLRYLIYFLEIDDTKVLHFMDEYSTFRKTWFEHEDREFLVNKYLKEAIEISWKMIALLDHKMIESWICEEWKENEIQTWRYPTLFTQSHHRENTELFFEKVKAWDRFLSLPHSFNVLYWSEKWKEILKKIRILDPQFARFDFLNTQLNLLLFIKKGMDSIRLSYYQYFFLWKK